MQNNGQPNNLLLPNEAPLVIQPSIARVLGIKGAVVLQCIHKEMISRGKNIKGRFWIEGPLEAWYAKFDFMLPSAVKNVLQDLGKKGVLISDSPNRARMDMTKWYTINYDKLGLLFISKACPGRTNRSDSERAETEGATP